MLQSLRRSVASQRFGITNVMKLSTEASPSFEVDLGQSFIGHCKTMDYLLTINDFTLAIYA